MFALMFSCSSETDIDCSYQVVTTTITESVEEGEIEGEDDIVTKDTIMTQKAISYCFYVDISLVRIDSYENASKGIMTIVSNDTEIKSDIKGFWDEDKGVCTIENIIQEEFTIVVCDPATRSWAYRLGTAVAGLDKVVVDLEFTPVKISPETPTYTYRKWSIGMEQENNGILIDELSLLNSNNK